MDKVLLLESSFPGRVGTSGRVGTREALPGVTARCADVLKVRKKQLMKD